MTLLLILIAVIALAAIVRATLHELQGDGLHANRQPPASHHRDSFDQRFGG